MAVQQDSLEERDLDRNPGSGKVDAPQPPNPGAWLRRLMGRCQEVGVSKAHLPCISLSLSPSLSPFLSVPP